MWAIGTLASISICDSDNCPESGRCHQDKKEAIAPLMKLNLGLDKRAFILNFY